jgi:hypothetical protein
MFADMLPSEPTFRGDNEQLVWPSHGQVKGFCGKWRVCKHGLKVQFKSGYFQERLKNTI